MKTVFLTVFVTLILTSSMGLQLIPISVEAEESSSKRVVGYFPWYRAQHINTIDYEKVTHINYFHIWPNSDGSLVTSDININDMHAIRDNAHSVGATISISVGGWGVSDGFVDMAASSTARAAFVQNIVNFINTHNLDGVDIDWEPVETETKKDNLAILLQDLGTALLPSSKLVTVAVNGERMELRSSAVNSVSWVNVMAYDLNWNNAEHSTFSGAVAALDLYENAGIPKEKLVLGVPFYGRNDGWTSALMYSQMVASCNPAPSDNYCNGHFFNGIDLITQKAQYVLDNGYDGVMIWELGQDTFDNTSLLSAIYSVLGTSSPLPDMPPNANPDSYLVESENTLTVLAPGVLENDNDPNGDAITAILETSTSNGVLNFNSDGSFTYLSNQGFEGTDSFSYRASDGTLQSDPAVVTLTVNPPTIQTITITNPLDGSILSGKVTIIASVTGFENDPKVSFFLNSTLLGNDTSAPFQQSFHTKNLQPGFFVIKAVIFSSGIEDTKTVEKQPKGGGGGDDDGGTGGNCPPGKAKKNLC